MPGVAAAILELWEEALPTLPPSLLHFSSCHLRASLLESIAVLIVSASLKYLPSFPSDYHPVFLLPTSYILLSGFTCSPPICSSFTHNQPSDLITFMNCLTIRSPLPFSLANPGSIFQFIFLNISATLDSLDHHSLSFLKCVTLLSSRRVCVPWPPPPLWLSSFASFMDFPSNSLSLQSLTHNLWPHPVYTPWWLSSSHILTTPWILMTINMNVHSRNLPQLHAHASNHSQTLPPECLTGPWNVHIQNEGISRFLLLLWSLPASSPSKGLSHSCLLPLPHTSS